MSQPSSNNPVPTLSDLMDNANANWRVFDMGRRIQSIGKQEFAAVEANTKPYPYPIQQKARFALVFWDKAENNAQMKNPFIWFLQFDLDEMGLLKLQQRDHYISLVIKELGNKLVESDDSQQSVLDNHPYSFTPDQNRQAAFNAKVKISLKQPASMYYEYAQAYFTGQLGEDKWQDLTVQGIADFVGRLSDDENEQGLIRILPQLTVQILGVLGATLEHEEIGIELTQKLIELQNQAMETSDHEEVLYFLRAMAGSKSRALIQDQLMHLLTGTEKHEENLFIIIAGRFWSYLNDKALLHAFFEHAALHSNQQLFAGLFADLVAVPEIRTNVLGLLRDPSRPEAVSRAIGQMFGNA